MSKDEQAMKYLFSAHPDVAEKFTAIAQEEKQEQQRVVESREYGGLER